MYLFCCCRTHYMYVTGGLSRWSFWILYEKNPSLGASELRAAATGTQDKCVSDLECASQTSTFVHSMNI